MPHKTIEFKEYTLLPDHHLFNYIKTLNLDHLESIKLICFTLVLKPYSEAILSSRLSFYSCSYPTGATACLTGDTYSNSDTY